MRPTVPEPGATGRSWSSRTRVGFDPDVEKRTGPEVGTSAAVTRDEPWIPASDDPKPSLTMTCGKVARIRALQLVDSGAPPFEIENRELRSGRSSSGMASHA